MFRGTFTALVTPFRDGAIDTSAFEKLIEAQIAAGITGIVAVGTTGESPTVSPEEREQLIRLSVTTANKRCQVLAGNGQDHRADGEGESAYSRHTTSPSGWNLDGRARGHGRHPEWLCRHRA